MSDNSNETTGNFEQGDILVVLKPGGEVRTVAIDIDVDAITAQQGDFTEAQVDILTRANTAAVLALVTRSPVLLDLLTTAATESGFDLTRLKGLVKPQA